MPVGRELVNAVASVLTDTPKHVAAIRGHLIGNYSSRAVRYALAELVKTGRAKKKGRIGHYIAYVIEE